MNPVEMEKDMVEKGHVKAATKAKAYMLDKNVKAVLAAEYMKARESHSQGDSEQVALTTLAYIEAVREAADALEAAETAKVEHDALIAKFEAWRTLTASRREQIRQGVYADS